MMDGNRDEKHKPSILAVDDTVANLKMLSEILLAEGYRVRSALSGPIALRSIEAERPDLVLLDIRMPEMDGFETCRRIKEYSADLPIIFISALDAVEDKVAAFDAGGVDYIVKPFKAEEVRARIGTHIALARSERELRLRNAELIEALGKLKRAEASLARQERMAMFGLLAAKLAHELNNPLSFVASNIESLREYFGRYSAYAEEIEKLAVSAGLGADQEGARASREIDFISDDCKKLIDETIGGLARIGAVVHDLMAFSVMSEGRKINDVNEGVKSTLRILKSEIEQRASLDAELAEIPAIECDLAQLNQAFLGLILYCLKRMGEGGTLRVATGIEADRIRVEIAASPRRPEPADGTSGESDAPEGGLDVARDAVRLNRGTIEEADRPEAGPSFTIRLPTGTGGRTSQ